MAKKSTPIYLVTGFMARPSVGPLTGGVVQVPVTILLDRPVARGTNVRATVTAVTADPATAPHTDLPGVVVNGIQPIVRNRNFRHGYDFVLIRPGDAVNQLKLKIKLDDVHGGDYAYTNVIRIIRS